MLWGLKNKNKKVKVNQRRNKSSRIQNILKSKILSDSWSSLWELQASLEVQLKCKELGTKEKNVSEGLNQFILWLALQSTGTKDRSEYDGQRETWQEWGEQNPIMEADSPLDIYNDGHSSPSKEQVSFNFMAAVTFHSDFGDQENI